MTYNITDIKVGDEVLFDSTPSQYNHDLYWKVNGFTGNQIHIVLTVQGEDQFWTIDISEVTAHIRM